MSDKNINVTRRGFLIGTAATAAGTAVLSAKPTAVDTEAQSHALQVLHEMAGVLPPRHAEKIRAQAGLVKPRFI